jgi:hypothetical protein
VALVGPSVRKELATDVTLKKTILISLMGRCQRGVHFGAVGLKKAE